MNTLNRLKPALICSGILLLTACGEKTPPPPSVGETVYVKNCKVCHASGINGAPIFGNAIQWGKRTPQGTDTLIQHAINGYGLMPAKGGKTQLTDDEVAEAVKFMLSQVQ